MGVGRGTRWVGPSLIHDIRATFRALLRSPAYTGSSIVLMALGIGATAATYGAIRAAVLRPLPLPAPEELVAVRNVDLAYDLGFNFPKPRAYVRELAGLGVFQSVAAEAIGAMNLGGRDEAERVPVAYVTTSYFRTLGVGPLFGRTFTAAEGTAGGDWHVAVLSHRLWMQRFAGSRSAIGSVITLNGHTYRVIGVMPATFTFPSAPDLWLPFPLLISNTEVFEAFGIFIPARTVARLRPGVTLRSANLAVARLERDYPTWSYMADSAQVLVRPLQGSLLTANSRRALVAIGVAALLVLLLTCLNFAGLLTARTIRRLPDLRVRVMLGASRGHIARMVAVEALLLAMVGAAGGTLVAWASLPVLSSLLPPRLLAIAQPTVDPALIGFAIGVSLLMAAVATIGFMGALGRRHVGRRDAIPTRASFGPSWRMGQILGGTQIALALLFVTGAGMMLRRVHGLATVDTGMDLTGVITGRLSFSGTGYASRAAITNFMHSAVAALSGAPGIRSAAAVDVLPIAGRGGRGEVVTSLDAPADTLMPLTYAVTPGYFESMGIPLLAGRDITWSDQPHAVVILNALAAKRLWPGEQPVGRNFSSRAKHARWSAWWATFAPGSCQPLHVRRCTCRSPRRSAAR